MKFLYSGKFHVCLFERRKSMSVRNFTSPYMCNYLKEFVVEAKMKSALNLMST